MRVLIITASGNEKSGWGRYSSAVVAHLRLQGVDVTTFESVPLRVSAYSLFRNMMTVRRAAREVDVVHALDGWPFGVYGLVAVVGTRKPLFINGVGTYSVAPLYSMIKGFLLRSAYRRAEKIWCISRYVAKQLQKAGTAPEKLVTVYLGATPLPVLTEYEREQYRQTYAISATRFPVILTVGAIKERKGQFDTLRAIEVLKKTYPDILYVAAGSGNNPTCLAQLRDYAKEHHLEDNFEIIDSADDRTLSFLYSTSTLLTLNSTSDARTHHFEGFGLVVLEAAQFGTPSVGSRESGIEEAIEDGVTGELCKQSNAADIATKIQSVVTHHEAYGGAAKKRYAQFTWEKTVAAYLDAYTRVI